MASLCGAPAVASGESFTDATHSLEELSQGSSHLARALRRQRDPDRRPWVLAMTHKSPCLRGEVEVIVRLARRHMGMGGSLYYAPSIPVRKESNARRAHALHLPHQEPILVLYDDTLFGGAEDGFLITPERLCWKNIWEHPRQLTWSDISPSSILVGGGQVHIAGGHVNVDCELTGGLTAFLVEMVTRRRSPAIGPYRDPALVPESAEVWANVDVALKGSRA